MLCFSDPGVFRFSVRTAKVLDLTSLSYTCWVSHPIWKYVLLTPSPVCDYLCVSGTVAVQIHYNIGESTGLLRKPSRCYDWNFVRTRGWSDCDGEYAARSRGLGCWGSLVFVGKDVAIPSCGARHRVLVYNYCVMCQKKRDVILILIRMDHDTWHMT